MADESKPGAATPPVTPPANTNKKVLATASPLERFVYDKYEIDHRGTEVSAGDVDKVVKAARDQNVELTELTN